MDPFSISKQIMKSLVYCMYIWIVLYSWNYSVGIMALHAEWTRKELPPSRLISPRRSGHAAAIYQNTPYVFGGYAEIDDSASATGYIRYPLSDLWRYQLEKQLAQKDDEMSGWEPVTVHGDIPGPRLVTAMATLQHDDTEYLYLFGGWDPQTPGTGGIILDNVYQFNSKTNEWKKLDVTLPDGPASRHVAVTIPINQGEQQQSRILYHNHRCQDYVWFFDGKSFRKQPTTGPCPSPRGLHAAIAYGTDVVMFGGAAQDQTMSNECFSLDTQSWEWKSLDNTAQRNAPSRRASPCMVRFRNHVLVFGGAETSSTVGLNPKADLWALNMKSLEWTLLLDNDHETGGPPPRNAATLSELDPEMGTFILTGGWAPFRQTWDDCFILKVSE